MDRLCALHLTFITAGGWALLALTLLAACTGGADGDTIATQEGGEDGPMTLTITSPAFEHEGMIPAKYTCSGDDISPEITVSNLPEGTRALAIVMDDPDAPVGTWDHWVIYNIPVDGDSVTIPEHARDMGGAAVLGRNSWGASAWGGPCPPGGTHRYFFHVLALETPLDLQPGARKDAVYAASHGITLARGELMGRYGR